MADSNGQILHVDTAIVGGTVIDGTGRRPLTNAVVLISGERIVNVFPRGELAFEASQTIEASGKTLIPGLIDCHTHVGVLADNSFFQAEDPLALADLFMREYIKAGVTTLRDTGNYDPDSIQKLLKRGRAEWPRFFGAGPLLGGTTDNPPPWRWVITVDDDASARSAVRRLLAMGMDFIKVYVSLKASVLSAVIAEAHEKGIIVTGHVGQVVTAEEAVRLGIDALEHIQIGPELLDKTGRRAEESLPRRGLDSIVSWRPWRFIDPKSDRVDALIELLAERGVFLTPTLSLSQSILKGDIAEVIDPPGIEVMPESVRSAWKAVRRDFYDYSHEDFQQGQVELERQMKFIGRAQRGGVRITAGTDVANASLLPGPSLHTELQLLVESGLSSMEAIVAATGRAAELLGQQENIGTIQKRRLADLVILDADPLADVTNVARIEAVIKSGRVASGSVRANQQTVHPVGAWTSQANA